MQGLDDNANEAPRSTAQGIYPEAPEAGEGRGSNCDKGGIREVDGLGQSQGQGDNGDALARAEREDRDTDSRHDGVSLMLTSFYLNLFARFLGMKGLSENVSVDEVG